MKKISILLLSVIYYSIAYCQSVGIGTSTPAASAMLEVKSAVKGLLIPRTSTVTRTAIVNPAKGLLMYDTTVGNFFYHNGTAWVVIPGGSAALSGWSTTGNAGTNPAANYIGTSDNASLQFKVNNLPAGKLTPNGNVFFGSNSGLAGSTGHSNIGIGAASLKSNTTKSNLVAIGDSALFKNGTNIFHDDIQGLSNVAIGSKALYANATGSWNTAVGFNALKNNIGYLNTTQSNLPVEYEGGNGNTAVGANSLLNNDYGLYNTATGANSLTANKGGSYNTASGFEALASNLSASDNTAIGNQALKGNIGPGNTAVGSGVLKNNLDGTSNVGLGSKALLINKYGSYNVALGASTLINSYNGSQNVAVGYVALQHNISGAANVAVGFLALGSSEGDYNIGIGYNSGGNLASGSNNIFIGNNTEPNISNTASNQLNIGNWIKGYNGNIGLGIANPAAKLDVVGNIRAFNIQLSYGAVNNYILTSDGFGNASWSPPAIATNYWTNAGASLYNNSGDNVGIGKNNPSEKLDVNGKIKTTALQITDGAANGFILVSDFNGNANWTSPASISSWTVNGADIYSNNTNNVGIGTNVPSQKLEVNGNVLANNVSLFSDARYKKEIATIQGALSGIMKLRGTNYFFNTEAFPAMNFSGNKQLGVLAQEVEAVYPELVTTDKNGFKSVNYLGLIPVLIEGMKEQQKMILQQQKQIDALIKK